MICLGLTNAEKKGRNQAYAAANGVTKVYVVSPQKCAFDCGATGAKSVEWAEIIEVADSFSVST
jgi:hypothetical protein